MTIQKITIYGAGSIGCFIGGSLLRRIDDVTFFGRASIDQILQKNGLQISDYSGQKYSFAAHDIRFCTEIEQLHSAKLVLLCVKSGDTATAARELAGVLSQETVVVSLQNGVGNAEMIKQFLPNNPVIAGMVPFNVVNLGHGRFHRGTEGTLVLEKGTYAREIADILTDAGVEAQDVDNFEAIQWTKLLMNLNNAVNALSGIPLLQQLHNKHYRAVMAKVTREALRTLNAANIPTARVGKVIPAALPLILSLPTWAFRRVASAMLKIDPQARSSMYEDLVKGRKTEVDFLNGKIVALAKDHGLKAPINEKIVRLVHQAEERGQGSPELPAREFY